MAYNRTFNPDALPAHAEPEQAAQALSQLNIRNPQAQQQQKPSPRPNQTQHHSPPPPPPRQGSPGDHRRQYAPQQQTYRPQPSNLQTQPVYNNQQHHNNIHSPTPPSDYGQGPRPYPPQQQQQQQQYAPRPPPPQQSFPPPDADSADLYPLFRAANISQTGSLTTSELGSALVNADFTPFDPLTIRSLMRMFSTTPFNHPAGPSLSFPEFQSLWRFLAAWRELFERFDEDASGKISLPEFSNALVAFGYRLSQPFTSLLYSTFNERGVARRGSRHDSGGMGFDLFVQACIRLKRMTDVFKSYDDDRDGYVTMSFEEFLSEILKLQEM